MLKELKTVLVFIVSSVLLVSCATTSGKLKYIELHTRECNICNRMIPVMEAASVKYKETLDVETYGSTSDTGAELVEKYKIRKYPANLFLDPQGNLFFRYEGLLDQKSVEEILDKKIKSISVTEAAK